MRFSYHTKQLVPYPVEQVFAIFANPDNLPLLMPVWQHARIDLQSLVPPPPPPHPADLATSAAGVGSQITLSFRPFPGSPFRFRWHASIVEFVWNEHFCDLQISGPFAYWNHCHYTRPMINAGTAATLIVDELEYELPFGFAGELAHGFFLRRQIERTFTYRQSQLARILAQATPEPPPL